MQLSITFLWELDVGSLDPILTQYKNMLIIGLAVAALIVLVAGQKIQEYAMKKLREKKALQEPRQGSN